MRCGRERGHVSLLQSSREDEFRNKVEEEFRHFAGGSELSFPAWADGQVRRILASRTPFSFYLVQAIIGCRGGRIGSPSTALFPIPLPCLGIWESACGRGMKSRVARACQKLLHLAILALNFEYLSQPLSTLSLLRRPPAVHHVRLYGRLLGFIKASTAIEKISFLGCGRKSHQFSARIEELFVALTKIGVASATHYGGSFAGVEAPLNNEAREELMPYTSLDPSRLKLTGRGLWDCEDFLGDLFWLVFKEPRVNRFSLVPPSSGVPDVSREDPVRIFDLCRLWDQQGLLVLCPEEELREELQLASRVFNCRKNSLVDRQIGDRRAANSVEGRLSGESKCLPAGPNLLQLHPLRYKEVLVGCCTDRKDFYHQFAVTWERATSNFLLPGFKALDFIGFAAHDRLLVDFGRKRRRDREKTGDFLVGGVDPLHPPRSTLLVDDASRVVPCFGSLFQGDHLGVEFASEAHYGLLCHHGLLSSPSRLVATSALLDDEVVQGLYIDDFFVISREHLQDYGRGGFVSRSSEVFHQAKDIYQKENIIGSDDKDILDELRFCAVGAEVDSRPELVRSGLVACGLPAEKRLALATIASAVSVLQYTSDALHASLVGSIVSMVMYRRPAMSILQEVFSVIPPADLDTASPRLRFLPRKAAQEFALVSALAPVLASNLAAPSLPRLFATDASMEKGGIVETEIDPELSMFLWRDADKRGSNVPLESRAAGFLSEYDSMHESDPQTFGRDGDFKEEFEVPRPLGLNYDFVEVCGGSGVVTLELCRMGVVCGPILDLTYSQQYDLCDARLVAWCIAMMEQGRLRACTTYSPAAFPSLRSYQVPEGYDQKNPRVWLGNRLAYAALCLLFAGLRLRVFGLGEQPRRSKMRWLRHWKRLLLLGAVETWTASCAFGSPHRKEFCFLSVGMDASSIHRPCPGNHAHIPIQGAYTKPSAVYTPGLALALATLFRDHLRALDSSVQRLSLRADGLEDLASDDLCVSLPWRTHSSWKWKGKCHVNLLEAAATLKLYRSVALDGGDVRFVYLGDSHVARSSLARGRTSSHALRPLLKQASSLCIGYGLYPAGRFAPTRWNPADHPTRDNPIPDPVPSSLLSLVDSLSLSWICSLPKLRRWAAGWARLVLLLSPGLLHLRSSPDSLRRHAPVWISHPDWSMDFDATLGYPGEGPSSLTPLLLLMTSSLRLVSGSCLWVWMSVAPFSHGMPITTTTGDLARQRARQGIVLGSGRPVLEATRATRDDLFTAFVSWLGEKNVDYDAVFCSNPYDLDRINRVITDFGRELFAAGKPYFHYSETMNSITTRRPLLRRSLGVAWDLAFLWGSHEPAEHHVAVPHQVLLAILSVSILWGWLREAACFSLAFGALLRIGEITQACRADLLLPSDVQGTMKHILLRIREPKTRLRAARHQVGKMEQPDLIALVELGFASLKKHEKLWPFSPQTLRHRLDRILERLCLPCKKDSRPKPITPASFRAGGATWLISQCESSEVVRRRGRWCSLRTMEIYIQEVMAETYLNDISEEARSKVLCAASVFLELLRKACKFSASHLPPLAWVFLFGAGHQQT